MARLVLATRNAGKLREITALLAPLGVRVEGLDGFPQVTEIAETGMTFRDNALLKARTVATATGLPVLADDSGLEVDALGGEPGVFSARYGGPELDDAGRCRYLLERLAERGVDQSPARFVCVAALVSGEREVVTEGVWTGLVHGPPRGQFGFGYDPIFYLVDRDSTAAELSADEKNRRSHRGQAMEAMVAAIRSDPGLVGA